MEKETFWTLLRDSVLIQGIVTLVLVCVICYLTVTGQEIPDLVVNLAGLVIGFWFGSKVEQSVIRSRGV